MFDFIGTFIDGPLAGSSFGAVMEDDSSGGGGFLALGGVCTVLSLIIIAIGYIILSPFLSWAVLLDDVNGEASSIVGVVVLFAIEFIYILFRVRSNIRHWRASFVREIIYGILFYFLLCMILCLVFIVPIAYIFVGAEAGSYLIGHYGEWVGQIISSLFHQFIGIILFFGSLSVIPSLMIKGVSSLFINKIAKAAKVKL